MASVTIVLADTPAGGVSIYTDFTPAIGAHATPAQMAALEIINRTGREWGVKTGTIKRPSDQARPSSADARQ